jgi:hypothetical protein
VGEQVLNRLTDLQIAAFACFSPLVWKKVEKRSVSCGGCFRDGCRRTSYQRGTLSWKGMIYRVCGVSVVGLRVDMNKISCQVNISGGTRKDKGGEWDGVGK